MIIETSKPVENGKITVERVVKDREELCYLAKTLRNPGAKKIGTECRVSSGTQLLSAKVLPRLGIQREFCMEGIVISECLTGERRFL